MALLHLAVTLGQPLPEGTAVTGLAEGDDWLVGLSLDTRRLGRTCFLRALAATLGSFLGDWWDCDAPGGLTARAAGGPARLRTAP